MRIRPVAPALSGNLTFGLGRRRPRPAVTYTPASVTGWKGTARRKGPDPEFTSAARKGGIAGD